MRNLNVINMYRICLYMKFMPNIVVKLFFFKFERKLRSRAGKATSTATTEPNGTENKNILQSFYLHLSTYLRNNVTLCVSIRILSSLPAGVHTHTYIHHTNIEILSIRGY